MTRLDMTRIGYLAVILLPLLLLSTPSFSATHLYGAASNNSQLRQDLAYLNLAHQLNLPTSVWPLPWSMIQSKLAQLDASTLSQPEQAALQRIQQHIPQAGHQLELEVQAASEPSLITSFGMMDREDEQVRISLSHYDQHWQAALSLTETVDPLDGKTTRLDGSFISAAVMGWQLGVGALDRWWGPSWHSSLILSHNARPIPSIFISRNQSTAFETPWLSWLGPWHLVTFLGELESNRHVPNARLWGARMTFQPHTYWEIGLSRTAQWAGDGRPSGFDTFWDLLIGNENFYDPEERAELEPGNQLGGIDLVYQRPIDNSHLSLYTQWIGEDEANHLPSHAMALVGISLTQLRNNQRLTTLYFEIQDTATEAFKSHPTYDVAYEHGIYQTGYRTYGRPIGASEDNDTRTYTWGLVTPLTQQQSLQLAVSYYEFNRDADTPENSHLVAARRVESLGLQAQYIIHLQAHQIRWYTQGFTKLPDNQLMVNEKWQLGLSYQYTYP